MIFLAVEHKKEIEPLLSFFDFKREGELFLSDNLVVYINYSKGGLSLSYKTVYYLTKFNGISLPILFGFSGGLNGNVKIGDFVFLKRIKLIDKSLRPIYNPIDLRSLDGFKALDGITLIDGFSFDNNYLSLFGDTIDKESYFFARALKSLDRFGLILRVISDYNDNDRDSFFKARNFNYDLDRLKSIIDDLVEIDRDELKREIFFYTGFYKDKLRLAKEIIERRRYTFSQRQRLYRRLNTNLSKCKPQKMSKDTIFIEKDIEKNSIKLDLNKYSVFEIEDYVGYFHNLKDRVAIIFSNKKGEFLRKTPNGYTPDGGKGYSILLSYNCIYDCAYCFLKGYFRSFNPVVFLNYKDYFKAIRKTLEKDKRRPIYFYAGTFSDPVALSFASDTLIKLIEFFSGLDEDVFLEIRTKSTKIDQFLKLEPPKNVIFAFSLSPQSVIEKYEFYTPSLDKRLKAIEALHGAGFTVGIRFDPVFANKLDEYEPIIEKIKNFKNLHSVEVGFLRFDKNDYKRMLKKSPCALKGLEFSNGMYRYDKHELEKAVSFFRERLDRFYLCMES